MPLSTTERIGSLETRQSEVNILAHKGLQIIGLALADVWPVSLALKLGLAMPETNLQ